MFAKSLLKVAVIIMFASLALLPAITASADPGVNGNNISPAMGVDGSPEWQAMMEALDAQWQADLAAAIQQGVIKGDLSAKTLGAAPSPAGAASTSSANYMCFPTCSETDGRFLALAGSGLSTLAGDTISLELAAPRTATTLEIGIFDGDTGGLWDVGTLPMEYTLYADPAADGSGTVVMGQWLGNVMPNNAWYTIAITNLPGAQAPGGHYFYTLRVRNPNPSVNGQNSFKVRTDGVVTMKPQAFAFIAAMGSLADAKIIYPKYPTLTPTTYDGTFDFYVYVPASTRSFIAWDGDLDFGSYDLVDKDTDDPDTPNAPFLPAWAGGTAAVPEGVAVGYSNGATGLPADDAKSQSIFKRSPSVIYEVIAPNGNHYLNNNPSGNLEWEQFRIDTAAFDRNLMDYHADSLPAGIYRVHLSGVDLSNLNAWRFDYDVPGVDANGNPCTPLHPYLVGDYVWYDLNGDGLQNECPCAGIGGVVINLVNGNGEVLATTTTDANGQYTFGVEPRTYTVQVAPANFNPGGALESLFPTVDYTADGNGDNQRTQTVGNANVLTYDFGYKAKSGILGDTVWYDANSNGLQDAGEPGLNGVTVYLAGDMDNDGIAEIKLTATTTTTAGLRGQYLFDNLPVGSFTVTVDPSTLPGGTTQTYDLDGTLDNKTTVKLGASEKRTDLDFGYTGTHPIGNTVWIDGTLGTDDGTHGTGPGANAFKTIQYAINNTRVVNGYTIIVAAGTYTPAGGRLIINKSITLQADPAATTKPKIITNYMGWSDCAIQIAANNVVLDGFEIDNSAADTSHLKGYIVGDYGGAKNGWTVRNCDIHNGRNCIRPIGNNVTIEYNDLRETESDLINAEYGNCFGLKVSHNWLHSHHADLGGKPAGLTYNVSSTAGADVEVTYNYVWACRTFIDFQHNGGLGPVNHILVAHNTVDYWIGDLMNPVGGENAEQMSIAWWTSGANKWNGPNFEIRDNLFTRQRWYAVVDTDTNLQGQLTLRKNMFWQSYLRNSWYPTNAYPNEWPGPRGAVGWDNMGPGNEFVMNECLTADPLYAATGTAPDEYYALKCGSPAWGTATDGTNIGAWQEPL